MPMGAEAVLHLIWRGLRPAAIAGVVWVGSLFVSEAVGSHPLPVLLAPVAIGVVAGLVHERRAAAFGAAAAGFAALAIDTGSGLGLVLMYEVVTALGFIGVIAGQRLMEIGRSRMQTTYGRGNRGGNSSSVSNATGDQQRIEEARYRIVQELAGAAAVGIEPNAWVNEFDRWTELVFALLTRLAPRDDENTRATANDLRRFGLLDPQTLADPTSDVGSVVRRRMVEALTAAEWSPTKAEQAAKVLSAAADGLVRNFDGKVQRYLRRYGELMLAEVPQYFDLPHLSDAETRTAFAYWLQNVADMPISTEENGLEAFCKKHDLTAAQVVAAADEMDLNLAVLDDLLVAASERSSP